MFSVGDEVEGTCYNSRMYLRNKTPIVTSILYGDSLEDTYLRFNGEDSGFRASNFRLVQPISLENE